MICGFLCVILLQDCPPFLHVIFYVNTREELNLESHSHMLLAVVTQEELM